MNKLYVFADFDWLDSTELIGELTFETIRGNQSYGFSFSEQWLKNHGDIFLGDDLLSVTGYQYTRPGQDIFLCFSDALPDRWGRTLLNRREQIEARDQNRPVRHLNSFDYLVGIDDFSRMGGFRFSESPTGKKYINTESSLKIPPLSNIRELMSAVREIEESEEKHVLPNKKWMNQLLRPGTSLGGARPKASIIDEKGFLTVAKFPSRKDTHDIARWEHWAHIMAKKAGINVAGTRIISDRDYSILLSKRFDRTDDGNRIHFASALTLLGLSDGDNASTGYGYPDIVDFIVQHGSKVEQTIEELYRRVAFNIIIGNSDDHFRNHGFLLSSKGWELSPAYDLNPTLSDVQSLLISRTTDESDLNVLSGASEDYLLRTERAAEIINEVRNAMQSWELECRKLGMPQRDIDMFGPRISRWL